MQVRFLYRAPFILRGFFTSAASDDFFMISFGRMTFSAFLIKRAEEESAENTKPKEMVHTTARLMLVSLCGPSLSWLFYRHRLRIGANTIFII